MIDQKKQLQQSPGAPPVPRRGRLRPGILHNEELRWWNCSSNNTVKLYSSTSYKKGELTNLICA